MKLIGTWEWKVFGGSLHACIQAEQFGDGLNSESATLTNELRSYADIYYFK